MPEFRGFSPIAFYCAYQKLSALKLLITQQLYTFLNIITFLRQKKDISCFPISGKSQKFIPEFFFRPLDYFFNYATSNIKLQIVQFWSVFKKLENFAENGVVVFHSRLEVANFAFSDINHLVTSQQYCDTEAEMWQNIAAAIFRYFPKILLTKSEMKIYFSILKLSSK